MNFFARLGLNRLIPRRVEADMESAIRTAEVYQLLRSDGSVAATKLSTRLADAENAFIAALGESKRLNTRDVIIALLLGETRLLMPSEEARRTCIAIRTEAETYLARR